MTDPGPGPTSHARLLGVLAYLGGLVSGIVVLAFERQDAFVRFHAMQSIVTFAAALVADLMLRGLGLVGMIAVIPFVLAVAALWIYLIVQTWRGERFHVPYIGVFADHLLK